MSDYTDNTALIAEARAWAKDAAPTTGRMLTPPPSKLNSMRCADGLRSMTSPNVPDETWRRSSTWVTESSSPDETTKSETKPSESLPTYC